MWRQWDESVTSPSTALSVPRPRVERVHPGARQAGPVAESHEPAATVRLGRRVPWAGWCFTQFTLLPVLLALAWLIPGAALLMAGRLRPAPALLISAPLAVILIAAALRRVPGQRLVPAPGAGQPGPGRARLDRLVGPGGHGSRRGRVRGVADPAQLAADHRAAAAGRGLPARATGSRATGRCPSPGRCATSAARTPGSPSPAPAWPPCTAGWPRSSRPGWPSWWPAAGGFTACPPPSWSAR